jgi:hypothetical protein
LHPWPRWRCHCPCSNNNKKSFNFSSSFLPIILRNRTKPILHKGYKKKKQLSQNYNPSLNLETIP